MTDIQTPPLHLGVRSNYSAALHNSLQMTDPELYQRLGFSFPPSDRELEIKIVSMIQKYSDQGDQPTPILYTFFNNVYDHFFDVDQRTDSIEGFAGSKDPVKDKEKPGKEKKGKGKEDKEKAGKKVEEVDDAYAEEEANIPVNVVSNVTYARDKLNPILKQTIQRIISIDSKYRNIFSLESTASNFTIELSEPLKDVLSMKLYSFQIPNTWYTVSKSYGSNFFYLKGNAPGINTGNFDYQIAIQPGNYSNADLVLSISKQMKLLQTIYTDVSFGNTDISYNSFNSLSTITVNIQNAFDQSNYYIDWTLTPNPAQRDTSNNLFTDIPSFLGYSNPTYSLCSVVSGYLPYPNTSSDSINNIYSLTDSNNYITLSQLNESGTIDFSFNLVLDLPVPVLYSRNQLESSFSQAVETNPYVNAALSSLTRVKVGTTLSYYDLSIRFNRSKVPLLFNDIIRVDFPTETASPSVWTGVGSCFNFDTDASLNVFNQKESENSVLENDFAVTYPPVVQLQCIQPNYTDNSNNYIYTAYDLSNGTFPLNSYISGINNAFSSVVLDPSHLKLNNTAPFLSNTERPELRFDFQLSFNTSDYYIDISQSILGYLYFVINETVDIQNDYLYDLAQNAGIVTGVLGSSRLLNLFIPTSLTELFLVKPKYRRNGNNTGSNTGFNMTHGLSPGVNYVVPFTAYSNPPIVSIDGIPYYAYISRNNLTNLTNDINQSLLAFSYIPDNDTPISSSVFAFGATNAQGIAMNMNMRVTKYFSQNNFQVLLYDDDLIGPGNPTSSWVENLFFDATPYDLANYYIAGNTYTDISGSNFLNVADVYLDLNSNFFYIRPFSDSNGLFTTTPGQYTPYYYNDIRVELPVGLYNTNTLAIALNTALAAVPELSQSTFSYYPLTTATQYAVFNIKVNKVFTANDYILNFYDSFYFYKCYTGESSIRNTTWDTTLGWILGFRSTQYDLSLLNGSSAIITSDVTVNVNMYSYFLITVDDYNQCRLNDGLVSITKPESNIPLPGYTTSSNVTCDPGTNNIIVTSTTNKNDNNLTLNQVYSLNQIQTSLLTPISKSYSQGPFIKDIFGIIPLKTAGLNTGQVFSDYGGSLQQQERLYFGPVNIRRLQIQLFNNQGAIMDLNGADWSFSFICEQLYQQSGT